MNEPVEVLSVDSLIADPGRVFQVSPDIARTMLAGLAGLLPLLLAQSSRDTGKAEPPSAPERWLDAEEVAAILHVPKSWVYESARNGRLKSARHGKYVRFREQDIKEYQIHGRA